MRKKISIIFINILLIVILGEIVSRVFPKLFDPPPPYNTAQLDEVLGWRQKEGYKYVGEQISLDNEKYVVEVEFAENGFRKFTSAENDTIPRVLIIGDSFTQAIEVSNGSAFYDYLEKISRFQVFAYGMAGYGTLQEYLVLDQYFEEINPSIVILQFCSNDFIDNELELEKGAIYRVGQRRPYLSSEDEIVYAHPLGFVERNLLRSKFLKFGIEKFLRLKNKLGIKKKGSSEERIAKERDAFEPYKKSRAATSNILKNIKSRIGNNTQLMVMNADAYQPQERDLEKICKSLSIPLIKFPNEAMQKAKAEAEVYTIDRFHWNERGHKIVGENLIDELQIMSAE